MMRASQVKITIRSLPKEDKSPAKTLARMKAISNLWAALPNVPANNAPLTSFLRQPTPLMPHATASWLVDNTALSFSCTRASRSVGR